MHAIGRNAIHMIAGERKPTAAVTNPRVAAKL
jgi:hypothetical protein